MQNSESPLLIKSASTPSASPQPVGEAPVLDYARKPPWYQNRIVKLIRKATMAVSIAMIGFWLIRTFVADPVLCAYWKARCASYSAPPTTLTFSTDPAQVKAILAKNGRVMTSSDNAPAGWSDATLQPEPWPKLHDYFSPGLGDLEAIPFLYQRSTKYGKQILVAIDLRHIGRHLTPSADAAIYQFGMQRIEDTTPSGRKRMQSRRSAICTIEINEPDCFTIFAGQPDSKDPSRFEIPYSLNGVPGVISGIVVDDFTTTLHVDSGPLVLEPRP